VIIDKNKKEGNEELMKEVEALGQVIHLQGFSIACVADILEKVEAELPKVAQEAGWAAGAVTCGQQYPPNLE